MGTQNKSVRTPWGAGRVAFTALQDTIRLEVTQNYPLTSIYARHKDALGISYTAFVKLVRRYLSDAKPAQRLPTPRAAVATLPPASRRTAPPATIQQPDPNPSQGAIHAGHEPLTRTFTYDATPKQDDKSRLLGEPSRAAKK